MYLMNDIEHICNNCKYFIGKGDFGLCCELKYELCYEYDTCNQWKVKEALIEKGQYNG